MLTRNFVIIPGVVSSTYKISHVLYESHGISFEKYQFFCIVGMYLDTKVDSSPTT